MSLNNSIFTIRPYKLGAIWVFDDEKVGLKAEAFVAGATEYLTMVAPEGVSECTVIFSPKPFPGYEHEIEMDYTKFVPTSKEGGTYYYSEEFQWELWLCPALLIYFPEPPEKIYIQVTK